MALWSFLLNLLIALLVFAPFLIFEGGLFSLGDDFDAQELAFNIFANREIKELEIFFNWSIDIGSDFISSFSFYNLGSPFFWITLPFSPETFPWLVGWIFVLKYAVAGLTSFLWIRRHASEETALLGSVLYAFSGFQAMNLIFYHFHDAVAFFPLLLIGLELLAEEKRKGIFALTVAINALVNWNFFVGEVIFAIFYYLCFSGAIGKLREGRESRREVRKQVFSLLGEGILGVGIAGVLFIPSVYAMLGQSRVSDTLPLSKAFFWTAEDYLRNLKALLFPAEAMNNNTSLSVMNWYSAGAYLPMVGAGLCITRIIRHRGEKNPLSRGLLICFVFAMVPILNNAFVLFNVEPYRRWYYMPILLMTLASAKTAEELRMGDDRTRRIAVRVSAVLLLLVGLVFLLLQICPVEAQNGIALYAEVNRTWVWQAALAGPVATLLILMVCPGGNRSPFPLLLVGICCFAWMTQTLTIVDYRLRSEYSPREVYTELVTLPSELEEDVLPYRYANLDNDGYFNITMTQDLPSIDSFISIVDPGIVEFYEALGVGRRVQSLTGPVGTDRILSVKYYLCDRPELAGFGDQEPLEVYDVDGKKLYLFEDYYAIPIGQTYETYILRSEFDQVPQKYRAVVMLHDLVVRDEDEDKVKDRLTHTDYREYLDREVLWDPQTDVRARDQSAQLVTTTKAFRLLYPAWAEGYVFVSVPYSERWSATLDGEPVEILNINGLMAVPVRYGLCDIRFYYDVTINLVSAAISGLSMLAALVILIRDGKRRKRLNKQYLGLE